MQFKLGFILQIRSKYIYIYICICKKKKEGRKRKQTQSTRWSEQRGAIVWIKIRLTANGRGRINILRCSKSKLRNFKSRSRIQPDSESRIKDASQDRRPTGVSGRVSRGKNIRVDWEPGCVIYSKITIRAWTRVEIGPPPFSSLPAKREEPPSFPPRRVRIKG